MDKQQVLDNIERALQQAAIDGALSKEAVAVFHATVKENESLKADRDNLTSRMNKTEAELLEVVSQRDRWKEVTEKWEQREKELLERETEITKLELRAHYHQKRVEDHQKMVALIFRNPVTRSQVMTPGHPGWVDAGGMTQYGEASQKHDLESEET